MERRLLQSIQRLRHLFRNGAVIAEVSSKERPARLCFPITRRSRENLQELLGDAYRRKKNGHRGVTIHARRAHENIEL